VVTNHRGKITASSSPQWGTIFRIALPLDRQPEESVTDSIRLDKDSIDLLAQTVG